MDRQKERTDMSDHSNVTGMGDKTHPIDVINGLPIVGIAVIFRTKDGGVTGQWSSQTNEALCFKATCLTKWAANNIT